MRPLSDALLPVLRLLSAEAAHHAAILALKHGLVAAQETTDKPTKIGKVSWRNPVGMAAGFDKNGEAIAALFAQGFGAVECGTVTPLPQPGNPTPRMFRLKKDQAIINRLGFNNDGLAALQANLERQADAIAAARAKGAALGINIGKNKASEDTVADYVTMLDGVASYADYVTVNISSPNTPGLRDLQSGDALEHLLEAVCNKREQLEKHVPLWLKLAPDLDDVECEATAAIVMKYPIDALIIGNTTISRPDSLQSVKKAEQGGLSGAPLMPLSTDRLRRFRELTEGKLPLIGVGGIASPEDAQAKLDAGASAVQLYSALVYQGFSLVQRITEGL